MQASPAFATQRWTVASRRLCSGFPLKRGITWYATPKIIILTKPSRFACMCAGL